MGTCQSATRAVGILLFIAAVALADAPAPAPPAKPAEPVNDPLCVGWNNSWVVYRFVPAQGQWLLWNSPPSPLPAQAMSVVGPHSVAVIEPRRQCGGWLFDLHTQKWISIPVSPFAGPPAGTTAISLALVDRQLIVWGHTNGGADGSILDPKTMQWRRMAASPVSVRFRAATAVIGDQLLVWGGYGHNDPNNPRRFGPLADGAVYDVTQDKWEKMPDTPVAMPTYGYVWTRWNDRLVIFGGRTGQVVCRTGVIYDPGAKSWEIINDCPFELGHQSACAVHKDRLLVWSGASPSAAVAGRTIYSRDCGMYDFGTKKWEKVPGAPMEPRLLAFARTQGDQIIIWGGWISGNRQGEFLTDAATYDAVNGVWQKLPDLPGKVPYALHPGW